MWGLSYKLYRLFLTSHSFSVTLFTLGFRLFFYSVGNKPTQKSFNQLSLALSLSLLSEFIVEKLINPIDKNKSALNG